MKKEKIVLVDLREVNFHGTAFKVKKLVNTIQFKINDYLSKAEVEELLEIDPKIRNITVEIIPKKR